METVVAVVAGIVLGLAFFAWLLWVGLNLALNVSFWLARNLGSPKAKAAQREIDAALARVRSRDHSAGPTHATTPESQTTTILSIPAARDVSWERPGLKGTRMVDVRRELSETHGLHHIGWMRAGCCPGGRCRIQHEPKHYHAQIPQDIQSNVVYALLINGQVMKFGKAGSKGGSLRSRMDNTISAGNQAWLFAEGRPISDAGWMHRKLDKFKQMISDVIRAGQEIEIYAGEFAADSFEAKERELNRLFRPPWVDRDD